LVARGRRRCRLGFVGPSTPFARVDLETL
jgi:hypothetical protein